MSLSAEQREQNKETFINLINSIKRTFDKEKLINWLTKSDFFEAPASTRYHCNYEGGLCQHSLNVYYSLKALCETFATDYKEENGKEIATPRFDSDSIIIVSLFHDISKTNFYERYFRNVKNERGEWEQKADYRIVDQQKRFIFGNHEETSEYMARSFIPLTVEESVAILNHMGGKSFDSAQTDLSVVYGKYNLACLLHVADTLATFCLENENA